MARDGAFRLRIGGNSLAVSVWVSPKRTRTYPYARVYNTLNHSGKKITVIPFVKDEGADGDRDFLQWDTVSLMSLLDVYVIAGYYAAADRNPDYENKITSQRLATDFIRGEIQRLLSYQSSALHWNIEQINRLATVAKTAQNSYEEISRQTQVKLHAAAGIEKRIAQIVAGKDSFMQLSRDNAAAAQQREIRTIQPKEQIVGGIKASLNLTNYLGGVYHFTCDEAKISGDKVRLIEGKHTKNGALPSLDDIKDGLLKMILYANLQEVAVAGKPFAPAPVLKLTAKNPVEVKSPLVETLRQEATRNHFQIWFPWDTENA
ncbi:MAG: hypothetical protein LBP75_01055 [Planctomycetota bacterium]|nr:hypothetical protein [Planctomycetota bacterium]